MGDRGNIVFRQMNGQRQPIYLYSHWGGTERHTDAFNAIYAAKGRWGDESYAVRISLTELIGKVTGDTGYGVSTYQQDNEHPDFPYIDFENSRVAVLSSSHLSDPEAGQIPSKWMMFEDYGKWITEKEDTEEDED